MIDGKVAVAVVGCGGMGGGHAWAIAPGSGHALWMTDGSKGREVRPGDTHLPTQMVLARTHASKEERAEWARYQGFFSYNSPKDHLPDQRAALTHSAHNAGRRQRGPYRRAVVYAAQKCKRLLENGSLCVCAPDHWEHDYQKHGALYDGLSHRHAAAKGAPLFRHCGL